MGRARPVLRGAAGLALVLVAAAVLMAGHWGGVAGGTSRAVSQQVGTSAGGNGRPVVSTYDGLMVRRCEAVTVSLTTTGNGDAVRQELHAAATAAGTTLLDLPADVLPAAALEAGVPDVVTCLPQGQGEPEAQLLLAAPLPGAASEAAEPVLVHDLAFVVRPVGVSADEAADALDREGILSDELGYYDRQASGDGGALTLGYTGPLLNDSEVEAVREAVARCSGTDISAVEVRPRSASGTGVRLADEPVPPPVDAPSPRGRHGH
jgi:hypothetical protein